MDLGLQGKTALVTGGSKGIGLACAKALAAEGVRVAICSRSRVNVDAALARLPGAFGMTADLRSPDEADRVVATVSKEFGPLHILVTSAGAAARTPPSDLSPAKWREAMDNKFFSYINVIDPVVKQMAARGAGVVVNIIGVGGKVAASTHLPGGAANAALMLATVGLANAYAGQGVRVVGLNPGLTHTGRVQAAMEAVAADQGISTEEALRRNTAVIPMGRLADPEEIAAVAAFLCSAQASYLTGVVVSMDGAAVPMVV
jgi:NAD(P)-dependent dehydrogenase (short-subunit alcohol dehydrogenase family)